MTSDGWNWVLHSFDYYNSGKELVFNSFKFKELTKQYPEASEKMKECISERIKRVNTLRAFW